MSQAFDISTQLVNFGFHAAEQEPRDEDGEAVVGNPGQELLDLHKAYAS